ncbi:methyl-accepting chemotaxis protein [Vibrio parahaemolyticus]|uniref:methyl-accepting chemotaxis protein n=1 Tax=Vibrio parahaemolyticus TaxID=670 RepID=UPI00226AEE59|nr:methyl-accepting chemotaxis protein [Vibrio parahaemolyticus]MCX8901307.1 methyl-accepting chemotaxis protein [Vibrio parahaemolyticus]
MFKNLRLGLKIGLGFLVVLLLLSVVLGVGIVALEKANEGMTTYRGLARDTNLAGRLQANMLMVRMNVKGYLIANSDNELAQYEDYLVKMKTFLAEAKKEIQKPERAKLVKSIDSSIAKYEAAFLEVVTLDKQRDRVLYDLLAPQGETMRKVIAEIIDSAYRDNDVQAAYFASHVQEKLLNGRLFVTKFLNSNDQDEYRTAVTEMTVKLDEETTELKQYLQNATRQNLLSQFIKAQQSYVGGLNEVYRLIETKNDLVKNTLDQIGPQVAKNAEDVKLSVMADQEALGTELKSTTEDSINLTIVLSVLAIAIGSIAAYVLTISITRPIGQAVEAANQLAKGNLTIEVQSASHDETGLLLESIQRTATSLRNIVSTISGASVELASASEELAVVTEQSSQGIESQQAETDLVATAMNEMAATVHEVADNAAKAAEAANQADNEASAGGQVVEQTISVISTLAERVNESSEKLHEVEQESMNIGKILNVIREIADQTNLLALNAAIEAARAGEQGRGFAVVADEVRSLAQRTQESTQEIQTIIEQLQAGTQRAVAVMNQGKDQAAQSVGQVNETGSALQTITHAISVINDMNIQIASASEQQSSVAENINENVINVKRIAEENAVAANQMKISTSEVAQLSEQLKALVDQFKI